MIEPIVPTYEPWSLLLIMWFKPRQTIHTVIEKNPKLFVIPIIVIYGMLTGAVNRYNRIWSYCENNIIIRGTSGFNYPVDLIWGVAEGVAQALFFLYLAGVLINWIGRWFKVNIERVHAQAVYAWSALPLVVTSIFLLPIIFIHGNEVFACHLPTISPDSAVGIYSFFVSLLISIGEIWGFILMIIALSEIMGISKAKAFIPAFLSILILNVISFFYEFSWALSNY